MMAKPPEGTPPLTQNQNVPGGPMLKFFFIFLKIQILDPQKKPFQPCNSLRGLFCHLALCMMMYVLENL